MCLCSAMDGVASIGKKSGTHLIRCISEGRA
jgi:hypothetical protein